MKELIRFAQSFCRLIIKEVLRTEKKGRGARILGRVLGRPIEEDVKIEIDKVCDEILVRQLQITNLRVQVFSEHGIYNIGRKPPEFICAIDPFDGSGLYRRGFKSDWWSVLSFYDLNHVSLVGGAADILRKKIYLAEKGKGIQVIDLEKGTQSFVSHSRKTVVDGETRIACYLMSPKYLIPWLDNLRPILSKFPGIFVWPNGGSCIYPWIASGLVDAYVMFDEPRSEIDPGLAFLQAGGAAFSVEGKELVPYRFKPSKYRERVPFFIAACTQELAREIAEKIRD